MSRGVNKVILVGTLGSDPEVKVLDGGKAVTNFSIATSESWKDSNGEQQEKTEWHRIVSFGRQAEVLGEYLKKGSQVYIEGKLQTDSWVDENEVKRSVTKVMVSQFSFLGGNNSGNSNGGEQGNQNKAAPKPKQEAAPKPKQEAAAQAPEPEPENDFDDDIPF